MYRIELKVPAKGEMIGIGRFLMHRASLRILDNVGRYEVKRIKRIIAFRFSRQSGRLYKSPGYQVVREGDTVFCEVFIARERNLKKRPFYWRFLEFGTRRMSAKPFFYPTATESNAAFAYGVRKAAQQYQIRIQSAAEVLSKRFFN